MADNVFKFGTNRLVKVTASLCFLFGIWPKDNSKIAFVMLGYMFQALTTFGWTIAKCIATFMLEERKEIILFTASSVYCIVAAYRGFIFIWKYKTINACLNTVSEFALSKDENESIQQKVKMFCRISSAFTAVVFVGIVSAFLNPVLSDERVLPIPIWLPYVNWKENNLDFLIALIFSAIGLSSMAVVCAFTPIIVWYLMYSGSLKLKVLGRRLQNLGYESTSPKRSLNELLKCIKLHQVIVEYIQNIDKTFSSVFLLQITSSAVCICSIAYLMASESISENFNNFTMYSSLGTTYIYDIFALIYYGNEIADASDRLSRCIYDSNWIYMPMNNRKLIIIIVEKWKKPQELVVGKIFPMRNKILTSILNVAYSILNVLRKDHV